MKYLTRNFWMAMVLIIGFSACQQEKNIGIQLYSVRDDMKNDPAGTVAKVGEMGYKFVETAGYSDGKFYGMEPVEFKKVVEEAGMKFVSSHTGQDVPDKETWDETMAWWDQSIAAHKAAGVKYIVQPWMGEVGYSSLAGLKQYCDYFNAVGQKCKEAGIQFGYHNHAKEFEELEGEVIYDYMLKNTDPELVTFQLDLYWINEGGKNAMDYFAKYPGRFKLWHVKDEKELGESGKMDFKTVFENQDDSGMEYYIVEVERYNYEPLESVNKSIQYLQDAEYVKM
ncbi:MAG: sugar phosphate isomerase/epimerase family protein [Candidatus Cyclobacteriaceae bacterium M3_2C_046]